jgi:hypothetical protein
MQCDKKSLFAAVDASKKCNLMVVGGYVDNVVDLCGEDNTLMENVNASVGDTLY